MDPGQLMQKGNSSLALLSLKFMETIESRPFPMNLGSLLKSLISMTLLLVLFFGLKLRLKIFKYLASDEAKMKPINVLICIDQLNGLLQGISIIFKVVAFNLEIPLSNVLGATFCEWVDLPASFYLIGE